MRQARIRGEGKSYYHCISRVVDRQFVLKEEEKRAFCGLGAQIGGLSRDASRHLLRNVQPFPSPHRRARPGIRRELRCGDHFPTDRLSLRHVLTSATIAGIPNDYSDR